MKRFVIIPHVIYEAAESLVDIDGSKYLKECIDYAFGEKDAIEHTTLNSQAINKLSEHIIRQANAIPFGEE